ncbi:hypothetical protein [Aliamphritea spongicola]|uniref:hypothetical protein n=1 Tax=Aliamphritea spongicola TaxID=707589 RepID=UPI00196B9360|nr:hypothetical protein [Aliamphritea spongicola]MBN3562318.1 hypothetical protein [Aliamphritea spongicola]
MKTATRKRLIPQLIFMLLYAWGGHLFTLAVTVHLPAPVAANTQILAGNDDHGHSHDHDHRQQTFHQTFNITHQHPPQTADHLHDSVQLALDSSDNQAPLPATDIPQYRQWIPNPPLFLIERPPRVQQHV